MNEKTIKFYANYNQKDRRYFISGKNEKNKYYSLWKNPEFENNWYLDTDLFKGGLEIEKSKLKLLPREDGEESKVLVFKNLEDEKGLCISQEDIQKRKKAKKQSVENSYVNYVLDLFRDLFANNKGLKIGDKTKDQLANQEVDTEEMKEVENDNDLPF